MNLLARAAVALAAVCYLSGTVSAQRQDLKTVCAELADSIKKSATADNQTTVQIGTFAPEVPSGEDVGPAIGAHLSQALGDFAAAQAAYVVNGKYAFVSDPADKDLTYVQITVEMVQVVNGKVQKKFQPVESSLIKHVGSIANLSAPTGQIPQGGTSKDANKALGKIIEKPTGAKKTQTVVQPHPASQFAVEILIKPNGGRAAPRAIDVTDGKPFVAINRGEVYEVKVYNYGPQEAAFSLSIDGLDQFVFMKQRKPDGSPLFGHLVLPPAKDGKPGETTVSGWYERFDEVASEHHYHEFLVTEHGKGAISKFPKVGRGKVGVIEVQFSHSFPPGTTRNSGETAQGHAGKTGGTVVKRTIDPAHEFLSVRYNRPAK